MGQQRNAGGVAERPDAVSGTHPIVDGHAARSDLQSKLLEPEARRRSAGGRSQRVAARPRPARPTDRCSRTPAPAASTRWRRVGDDARRSRPARAARASSDAGVGIEPREDLVVVLDDRDLARPSAGRTERARHRRRHLRARQALRDRARPDGVAVRPVVDVLESLDGRHGRRRAGRDHEVRRTRSPARRPRPTPGRTTRASPRTSSAP